MAEAPDRPSHPHVYTIPAHRSFADALVAGLITKVGREPTALAAGRILLPNNRAVRAVTDAFVRQSEGGLLLPRLIAIGDPGLDDRIGGALDPMDLATPMPTAIDPLDRQLALAQLLRSGGEGASEAMRLAVDLARTLDQLIVEDVDPARLAEVGQDDPDLAGHWQVSLDRLQAILADWPRELAARGAIDLTERRNRLLNESDWTQMIDNDLSDEAIWRWREYRQALRRQRRLQRMRADRPRGHGDRGRQRAEEQEQAVGAHGALRTTSSQRPARIARSKPTTTSASFSGLPACTARGTR